MLLIDGSVADERSRTRRAPNDVDDRPARRGARRTGPRRGTRRRRLRRRRRAARRLGRSAAARARRGLGARHQGAAKGMSSASDPITVTPSAAPRAVAGDQHRPQPGRAGALDVGLRRVADVPRVRRRGARRARARRGRSRRRAWRSRSRPRPRAPSTSGASPVSASRSCSDQSQLETTTVRIPASRSARSAGARRGRRGSAARPAARRAATRRRETAARAHRLRAARAQVGERLRRRGPRADGRGSRRSRPGSRPAPPPRRRRRPCRSRSAARRCGAGGSNVSSVPSASRRIGCRYTLRAPWRLRYWHRRRRRGSARARRCWSRSCSRRWSTARSGRRAVRAPAERTRASRARARRGCASCAGCSTRRSSLIGDRGRAVGLHRHLQARDQPAGLGRDRGGDHRLRRAPDAGELRRRDHARGHAADARRRLGDVRGQLRRGRGRAAELHDPAHGDRAADRDPEREARRRAC